MQAAADLTQAFALASPHEKCDEVREEVAFFQAVRVGLEKLASVRRGGTSELGHAVRQIVSNALVTDDVIDIFQAAGLPRPDISILSPEFLAEVEAMDHKNLAAAILARLLEDEIRARGRRNLVQGRKFSELLERALNRYRNRSIQTAEVINELLAVAAQMRDADAKGAGLGLSREESAFYEALAENGSAQDVMGDAALAQIAQELTKIVRENATIDWNHKRSVQAKLQVLVKRKLRERGYPPDAQEKATALVLDQAKALGINMTEGGSDSEAQPGTWASADGQVAQGAPSRPELPYPIAVFDSLVDTQENAVLRVKTRRDGFEKALTLMVGAEIALLRELGAGSLPAPARKLLEETGGKPVSLGAWLELVWRLAAAIPANSVDPVARAARSMIDHSGKPSDLVKEIQRSVVPERNTFSHAVVAAEEAATLGEAELHALWRRFADAMAPLAELKLVSSADLVDFDPQTGRGTYKVRVLQGPSNHFRLEELTVQGKLEKDWCYLVGPDGRMRSLSPIAACRFVDDLDRREVLLARTIGIEAGTKVELWGVTTKSKVKMVPGA